VTVEDIQTLAQPTLRHRILLNYRAEAEGMTVEAVIKRLLETLKPPLAA
jgi:MoxR-like ATPase